MNRGVEIESGIADHKTRSLITEQVEMGVAIRMAVLETLARNLAAQDAKSGAKQ
jgi:aspartate carbamoyltransferase catalytic subunit